MKIKQNFLAVLLVLFSLTFTGCLFGDDDSSSSNTTNPTNPTAVTYTVTFDSQGGSAVTALTVEENTVATEPAAPARSYYTFGGWYTEAACTTAWVWSTALTANVTLYAKWTLHDWENFTGAPLLNDNSTAGYFYDLQGTSNGDIYLVGQFETYQGESIRSVAKLSGSTWTQVGTGLDQDSEVCSILVNGSDIYIGGRFGLPGGSTGPKVFAKLDTFDNTWKNIVTTSATSSDFDGGTVAGDAYQFIGNIFKDSSNNICVVGTFGRAGTTVVNSVARLSSGTWSGFGVGFTESGGTMFPGEYTPGRMNFAGFTEDGTGFYVSGGWDYIDGVNDPSTPGQKAIWDGSDWAKDTSYYNFGPYKHYNADGSYYLKGYNESDGIPGWVCGLSNDNSTWTTDAGYAGDASGELFFAPDGTPSLCGKFKYIKTSKNVEVSPGSWVVQDTVVTANGFALYNGTAWEAYASLPADAKNVHKIFITPSGDIWIIADMSSPTYEHRVYRMKK